MKMWDPIQSRGDLVFYILAIVWSAAGFIVIGPWARSYYRRMEKPAPESRIKVIRTIAVVSGTLAIATLLFHFGWLWWSRNAA